MNISEFFIFVGLIFDSLWYSIAMNCGGRLRTTPEKSLMRRALFSCLIFLNKKLPETSCFMHMS